MPKQTSKRRVTSRTEPYELRRAVAPSMGTQLASYMPLTQHTDMGWDQPQHYQTQHAMQIGDYLNPMPPSAMPTPAMPNVSPMMQHQSHRYSTRQSAHNNHANPWTPEEDDRLMKARVQGMGWSKIHEVHFPDKSGNACRKRHERLLIRRRGTDWDEARMERLAVGYKEMRQEIWTPLAKKIGERWDHVEKACMQHGLKTLINKASTHARNVSHSSSGLGNASEYGVDEFDYEFGGHDDSGIGLGLEVDPNPRRRSRRMSGQAPLPSLDTILHHNQYA